MNQGTIRGNKKMGRYGRMVVNADGSVTLFNVVLENIVVRDCDLIAESGEYPIPFADRANQQDDWSSQEDGSYPFYVGGRGGEEVVPGDGRDTFDGEKAKAAAIAEDHADGVRAFGVEEAR